MARREVDRPIPITAPDLGPNASDYSRISTYNRAVALAEFLKTPLDLIHVTSVIPFAKFGTMYAVSLSKIQADGSLETFKADNASVRLLGESFHGMKRKYRKKYKTVLANLLAIREKAMDETNWEYPFNTRSDH